MAITFNACPIYQTVVAGRILLSKTSVVRGFPLVCGNALLNTQIDRVDRTLLLKASVVRDAYLCGCALSNRQTDLADKTLPWKAFDLHATCVQKGVDDVSSSLPMMHRIARVDRILPSRTSVLLLAHHSARLSLIPETCPLLRLLLLAEVKAGE